MCTKCLDEFKIVCNFKEMVIQSDMKLQNFYDKKIDQSEINTQNRTLAKEESIIKVEQDEVLQDITLNNVPCDIPKNILEEGNNCSAIGSTNKFIEEVPEYNDDATRMAVVDQNTMIKEENNKSESCELDSNDMCAGSDKSCFGNSDIENETSVKIKENDKKLENPNVDNERYALLYANPDFERILKSGLSKREKDHATITCKLCNRTFNFRYFAAVHINTHTGNLPYKCDHCNKYFPKKYYLTQHMVAHSDIKKFSCEECGKMFATISLLKSHKTIHSNDKPHSCSECNKSFKRRTTLRTHLLIHRNERNHICELCGKSFKDQGILHQHKKRHNTDKKFICTVCNKGFNVKSNLYAHVKVHSGEKSHKCGDCGKCFTLRSVLKTHMRIHMGVKPYPCKICNKEFRQNNVLQRHMRTHTGETPFPCTLCPQRFKYKHHLNNHMKVHNTVVQKESSVSK